MINNKIINTIVFSKIVQWVLRNLVYAKGYIESYHYILSQTGVYPLDEEVFKDMKSQGFEPRKWRLI